MYSAIESNEIFLHINERTDCVRYARWCSLSSMNQCERWARFAPWINEPLDRLANIHVNSRKKHSKRIWTRTAISIHWLRLEITMTKQWNGLIRNFFNRTYHNFMKFPFSYFTAFALRNIQTTWQQYSTSYWTTFITCSLFLFYSHPQNYQFVPVSHTSQDGKFLLS